MDTSALIQTLVGFLGSLAGSGPWGLAAMGVGIIAILFGVQYSIGQFNKKVDAKDQDNAGSDAGETAADLQSQTKRVASKLKDLGDKYPATEPTEKKN